MDRKTNPHTINLECFKQRGMQEFTIILRPDLEHGRFVVIDDSGVQESDQIVEKLKVLIRAEPGLCQEDLIERSRLPEHRVRKALKAGEDIHWKVERHHAKEKAYHPI